MSVVPLILIGAGGHAKILVESMSLQGKAVTHYVDAIPNPSLEALGIMPMEEAILEQNIAGASLIIGFVGLDCVALKRRYALMQRYQSLGSMFLSIIHPSSMVSVSAVLAQGVQLLPGAIINAGASLAAGAIINSGAIVEHDAVIGAGAHIAPHATVLGGARVGEGAFIGAGAVVVQGADVPAGQFVKALQVYK